jgi:hypothetical protein
MSNENLIDELRRHAVKLERHRKRVTRAQRSLAVVADAYGVVIEHLLCTASGENRPMTAAPAAQDGTAPSN